MANPISDFMSNWLNSTYKYLKETGGPTYPPATVGSAVLPTGPYSMVEDVGITEIPITQYGSVPLPFNPGATGIPATASSQIEAVREVAKQNPPPTTFSKNFGLLFGDNMTACITDQKQRACNPNALNACRELAERGDTSGMSLQQIQKERLGIVALLPNENNKPDDIRLSENVDSLTGQITEGAKKTLSSINALIQPIKAGGAVPTENPKGINFQDVSKKISDFMPGLPGVPDINNGTLMMAGGAALLILLLIVIIK